jgi:hypothetical protein
MHPLVKRHSPRRVYNLGRDARALDVDQTSNIFNVCSTEYSLANVVDTQLLRHKLLSNLQSQLYPLSFPSRHSQV